MSRDIFYKNCILKKIQDLNSRILVLGAGELDENVFKELGFKNITFSNYTNKKKFKDYYENILLQKIELKDNSYDYCVAHACIHHSSKPHSAVLEMYRVAKKGILVIEANDSLVTRISCKLGISEEYEKSAIIKNINYGGVDNTNIPNYVYRWTEREVTKLINSYNPGKENYISFTYGYDFKFSKNLFLNFFIKVFFSIFKKQQNLFAFFIEKN